MNKSIHQHFLYINNSELVLAKSLKAVALAEKQRVQQRVKQRVQTVHSQQAGLFALIHCQQLFQGRKYYAKVAEVISRE